MKSADVVSHWYILIEGFETSGLDFYSAVEEALKRRDIPSLKISRVEWQEGGVATAKRQYLRVRRGRLAFHVCAAPFGRAFFFSWWLTRIPQEFAALLLGLVVFCVFLLFVILWQALGFAMAVVTTPIALAIVGIWIREGILPVEEAVLNIPLLGPLYERLFSPRTYYRVDTALMFQESVKNAVLEVIGEVRNEKGLRALTEDETRPHTRAFAGGA